MITIVIPGDAVPFARAGALGKRRFTPRKQADWMAVVRKFAADAMMARPLFEGPLCLRICTEYVVPASWPKKRAAVAKWKATKPDASNLLKILEDSLNGVVWHDDAQVADLSIQKRYGPRAQTVLTISSLETI